jgi:hypothetical protein
MVSQFEGRKILQLYENKGLRTASGPVRGKECEQFMILQNQ